MTNVSAIVQGLKTVPAGVLPEDLFFEVCRLGVLSAVEVVPVRFHAGRAQVLLTQREGNDPFWAHLWHNPGTILRPTDKLGDFTDAFTRVCSGELGLTSWENPVFIAPYFWKDARGSVVSLVYYVRQEEYVETETARYWDANDLPKGFIAGMEPIIQLAVQAFVTNQKTAKE